MDNQRSQMRIVVLPRTITLRDVLTPVFRHVRLVVLSFVGILIGAILSGLLLPKQYEAQLKILVRRERVDPVVTSDRNPLQSTRPEISDEELNSEVELLKSRDLLEKVVLANDLHQFGGQKSIVSSEPRQTHKLDEETRVSQAVRMLEKKLQIELLKKTNLIKVTYESTDPRLAARVLTTLANSYLEKHLAVHRPPGAFDFFQQETQRYQKELTAAEAQLSDFSREDGAVAAQLQRDNTLQKLSESEATWRSTQAAVAETEKRIQELEGQLATSPARLTTQMRSGDNPVLPQLQSTLLNLELKRTELMNRFEPDYPLVKEIETQIAQTHSTIADIEKQPVRDETTDRDPTHEWLRAELTKSRTELAAMRARVNATAGIVRAYEDKVQLFDQKGTVQQGLIRNVKAVEENYLLYFRKREEARISDALDRQRIVNVAIAEAPTVPLFPSRPQWSWTLLVGVLFASVVSLTLAFASDYLNPSFRTPDELQQLLNLPVLAVTPEAGK